MIIPAEVKTYYERGEQLAAILTSKSFAPLTFDQYCQQQGISGERGRQLIAAAEVYRTLEKTGVVVLPATEAEARPLTTLPADLVIDVWNLVSNLTENAAPPTSLIESVVDTVRRSPGQPIRYVTANDLPLEAYPTDNDFDIPVLLSELQATSTTLPLATWGSLSRRAGAGTWHFYTDDSRYTALINDPTPVINSGCAAAVEPNFSIYSQTPRAIALNRIYYKRQIARTWQAAGIDIFVDLNVAPEFAAWNLIGVPQGWKAYATRGSTDRIEDTINEYEIACYHAGTREILFLVYGGGRDVQTLAKANNWLWFPEFMSRVK